MKKFSQSYLVSILSALCLFVLILDSKTCTQGAMDGIELCLRTVIPSLFPLMILSSIVTGSLYGRSIPILSPIQKLCKIPKGAECLLLSGLLGGYPVGAKCVFQAYKNGLLTKEEAQRMLGFCNNAGPSFIFGICGTLFVNKFAVWMLWLIHIISAIIVAVILPGKTVRNVKVSASNQISISNAVSSSVTTMAHVCGWIILFRVILNFFAKWFLWLIPTPAYIMISGLFELTNGCCFLNRIVDEQARFIICSVLLSFGGVCVTMQTASVVSDLKIITYIRGKLLQSIVCFFLSLFCSSILFHQQIQDRTLLWIAFGTVAIIFLYFFKKTVAFSKLIIYNDRRKLIKR